MSDDTRGCAAHPMPAPPEGLFVQARRLKDKNTGGFGTFHTTGWFDVPGGGTKGAAGAWTDEHLVKVPVLVLDCDFVDWWAERQAAERGYDMPSGKPKDRKKLVYRFKAERPDDFASDFADFQDEVLGLVEDVLDVEPTVVVMSGWGLHCYLWLTDPLSPTVAKDANKRLAHAINERAGFALVDLNATNVGSRVLRSPGSLNEKCPEQPVEVEILSRSATRLDVCDVLDRCPEVEAGPKTAAQKAAASKPSQARAIPVDVPLPEAAPEDTDGMASTTKSIREFEPLDFSATFVQARDGQFDTVRNIVKNMERGSKLDIIDPIGGSSVGSAFLVHPIQGREVIVSNVRDVVYEDSSITLAKDAKEKLRSSLDNLFAILEGDWNFTDGDAKQFWWNERGARPMWGGPDDGLEDDHLVEIRRVIERRYWLRYRKEDLEAAVYALCRKNRKDPVLLWLESLEWDGKPRVETILIDAFGAEDSAYVRAVSLRWFVAATARAFQPGCQMDTVLCLQSREQGLRKTSFFRDIGRQWYRSGTFDVRDKEAKMSMSTAWIYELGEMDAVRRSNIEALNSFLTTSEDAYFLKYSNLETTVPRRMVFAGTTNSSQPLNDPSGARRWWVVPVHRRMDEAWLAGQVAQLWAEAVHLYRAGVQWWLTPEEEVLQKDEAVLFAAEMPIDTKIHTWLSSKKAGDAFTFNDVARMLGIEDTTAQSRQSRSVGEALGRLGCERRRIWRDGVRAFFYFVPEGLGSGDGADDDAGGIPPLPPPGPLVAEA